VGLAELAARQHGVVSVRQLGSLGYSDGAIAKAVRAGRLHRLHRGVYAVGHLHLSVHGRCLAAVLACGPKALLSHHSAAWLWGLVKTSPVPIHVTGPVSRAPRPPVVLHHSRILAVEDRALEVGIPVTALPRTLLDLAAVAHPDRLRRMLKRAEELNLFDLDPVESLLGRAGGHHGRGRLQRALTLYRPPRFTRSDVERRFVELVEGAGLPRPATNFNEAGYELDVYWPELRFAVELDVFETHGTRESFEDDRLRQEDLKLAGVELTRVTGRRLEREPKQVIDRVARLLAQRERELRALSRPRGGAAR
jgi:Transcriptional regulator, AbiEi antitoxin